MSKQLISLIPTHGKSKEQIRDEVMAAFNEHRKSLSNQPQEDPLANIHQSSKVQIEAVQEMLKHPASPEEMARKIRSHGNGLPTDKTQLPTNEQ